MSGKLAGLVCFVLLALALGCAERESDGGPAADAAADADASSDHAIPDGGAVDNADAAQPHVDAGTGATPGDDAAMDDAATEDAGAPLCAGELPLRCGDRLVGSTPLDGADRLNTYACTARAESGPEALYAFETEDDCRVTLRLGELDTDLDLFVLETCEAMSSSECSSTPLDLQDDERIELDVARGATQHVVVDGYSGSAGTYVLAADCLCGDASADFSDGTWSFQPNRRWDGDPTAASSSPTAPLDEADYSTTGGLPVHTVNISDSWRLATIGDEPWEGELAVSVEGKLDYALTAGAFAGGRFVISSTGAGLEAELTLYGSGVPIASSVRGPLVRSR